MTTISDVHNSAGVHDSQLYLKTNACKKESDSIFACAARKAGMDGLADFFRDDWSANMARKAGYDKFADWIENKDSEGQEKSSNFFEKIARFAVKHPVLSVVAIGLSVFAGKQLYKTFANKSPVAANPAIQTVKPAPTPPVAAEKIVAPIDTIPKDIESVNKIIEEGLEYERSIHFKNLEIFQNATDKERELMLTYFRHTKKEKDLLIFASGNKPAMLEGIVSCNDDVFDALRNSSVSVAELLSEKEGNLIINNKEVSKIISENLPFFRQRLGLSDTTTVDEIFKIVKRSGSNPLKNGSKYADLRTLLLGYTKDDACHAQLVQDLGIYAKEQFYQIYRGDLEKYKSTLKKLVTDPKYTYSKMDPEFQADLIKKIDTLSQSAYRNNLVEPVHVFPNAAYEQRQLEALRDLALKLKRAQTEGINIGLG